MGPTAEDLVDLIRRAGGAGGASVRDRLVDVWIEAQILRVLRLRMVSAVLAGRAPGRKPRCARPSPTPTANTSWTWPAIWPGRTACWRGPDLGPPGAAEDPTWSRGFLFSPALTIGGGTAEVQRNIVAEKVLGLPRDP